MDDRFPPLERDQVPPSDPSLDDVQGDQIVVGNMTHTVAAIGRGASVIYNQALTVADQARAREDFEHEKLATAVGQLIQRLYDQSKKVQSLTDSPYKYLLPFEFSDAWRFFGRDELREEALSAICCPDLQKRMAVLHGDAGMGKTSFLRASLAPALIAEGHLPLLVRMSREPISTSVKRVLLPNLASLEGLQAAPLSAFLRQVHELLPDGKQVYVLVDQFEEFFKLPQPDRENFTNELADCLLMEPPMGHWLLSVQSAKVGYLSSLAPAIPQPLANTLVLPPLTSSQARHAILKPAEQAGLQVEDQLVDVLLQDLGGDAIDPSKLQLVCHMLAQAAKSGPKVLSLPAYEKAGRADTILRDHLSLVLQKNLPPEDSEPAWRALVVIAEQAAGVKQSEVIVALKEYQIGREQGLRVLELLENNRLIRLREQVYLLTSPSLLAPIHKWAEERAALEQAQAEARRQLDRVRDSALRGLFGVGAGFVLAFLLTNFSQTVDWLILPIVSLFDGLIGGVAGVFFIFALDIARASFHGRRRWVQVLWGGLAGAFLFAVAFLFHKLLLFPPIAQMPLAALEGAAWGLVAGIGTSVVMLSTRPRWQTIPVFAVLCALTLWLGEKVGNVYHRPRIQVGASSIEIWVLLAGAVLYLTLVGATLFGSRRGAARTAQAVQMNSSPTTIASV